MSEIQSEKELEQTENNSEEVDIVEKEHVREVIAQVIQSEFSGPIPPPSIIKGYEEVLPGSADRIIRMAEEQSIHRQSMERKMVDTEARDSLLGILFAFLIGIGCIVTAIVIVVSVPEKSGAIMGALFGITGIGSIVATFIKSTRSNRGNGKKEE